MSDFEVEEGSPLHMIMERMKEAAEKVIAEITDEDTMQVLIDQVENFSILDLGVQLHQCWDEAIEERAMTLNPDRFGMAL